MRNNKRIAVVAAGMLALSMVSGRAALAAENAYSIDMTDLNNEAWEHVAMTNDDTVTTGVCVRSASGENGEIVGFLYRGGAVTVLDKGAQWTQIESGNVKGYVKNEYLTYGTDAKGLAEHYGDYGVKASWNDVNMFAWDNKDAEIIGKANDGDTYSIVNNNGHWIEIATGEKDTAFVSEEDVDLVILVDTAVSLNEEAENRAASTPVSYKTAEYAAAAVYEEAAPAVQESAQSASYTESTESVSAAESTETTQYAAPAQESTQSAEVAVTLSAQVDEPAQEQTAQNSSEETYTDDSSAAEYTDGSSTDEGTGEEYTDESYTDDGSEADYTDESYTDEGTEEEYTDDSYTDDGSEADYTEDDYTDVDADSEDIDGDDTYAEDTDTEDTYTDDTYTDDTYTDDTYTEDTYTDDTYTEDTYTDDTYTEDTYTEDTSTQDTAGTSSGSDTDLLAAIIYCEAGNQPFDGMVAVGAVVMNRVASSSFPNTISEVIYQSGQFTPAYSGGLASALANGVPSSCYEAASAALSGQDPTGGCLYFNTSHGSGVQIGAHWFY
ncbi:MAG: cell wall hydrolase [Lachnospiraceae bacterium]|nr:cell wall hydrolase [Lachnospiraceae bacterium]